MKRNLFTADHEQYRETVRAFMEREVVPHYEKWEADKFTPRDLYLKAAEQGIYGLSIPEEFGGSGETDYRYRVVVHEEVYRVHAMSLAVAFGLQDDIVLQYLLHLCTPEQKQRWLPRFATGEMIGAIGMTEPGAGSDLKGLRTTAVQDGDDWVLNGQKTFISCGISADLVIVAARTDPNGGSRSLSLFAVEAGMPGFERGRKLDKLGLASQDTSELYFDNVRVPANNVIGEIGRGMGHMMAHLPSERLGVYTGAVASAKAIFDVTRKYCSDRMAFGQPIADFQHVRFELAEIATEIDVAEAYLDKSVLAFNA
ncbi:acyl-CoA dehydrogenase family protein, partial [Smaragdicoccus niigatensis]